MHRPAPAQPWFDLMIEQLWRWLKPRAGDDSAQHCGGRQLWLLVLFCLSAMPALQAQTIEVALTHWSYRLLDRLRTRGFAQVGLTGSRPLTREAMTRALLTAYLAHGDRLDRSEREALEFAFFEFSEEVARLGRMDSVRAGVDRQRALQEKWVDWLPGPLYANRRNLLSLESGALRFFFDPIFYRDGRFNDTDTLARSERVFQNTGGFVFWGTLGRHLGFYLNSRDTKEHGTRTYPTSSRLAWPRYGFARGHGTHVYHDETVAYLYLSLPHFSVMFGKNFNRWGPGYTGALALSDYATSYDQFKLSVQVWRAQFTYVHAALRQHPPVIVSSYLANGVQRQIFAQKYLAGHRLEIAPAAWLKLGVHETVIYGERGLEPAYLNPIMFYRSAEHYLGDRDNATLGLDFEMRPRNGVRLYGEWFVDDFSVARVGENWYGNKVAWLAGVHAANPLGLPRSDWRVEYVRLEPYVYSHTFPINVYKNYDTILGHSAGPNADLLHAEWLFWGNRRWQVQLSAERYRHGANPAERNVGGDVDRPFHVNDRQMVFFLDGIVERRTAFRLQASYELWRNLRLQAALETIRHKNAPATGGRREVQTHSLFLALGWNADE